LAGEFDSVALAVDACYLFVVLGRGAARGAAAACLLGAAEAEG